MKKLFAAVLTLSLASTAMAAGNLGVEFGSNFYKVAYTDNVGDHLFGQGQNFALTWGLDNDLSLGTYIESGRWSYDSTSYDDWEINAIQVSKGIVKNAAVGVNIGTMFNTYNTATGLLVDVFGAVTLVQGAGDKVSGVLKTVIAARFNKDQYRDSFSGVSVNMVVGAKF